MNTTVELLKSQGINGPHDLIYLTRYAALAGDSNLMQLVGNSLQELTMKATPWLVYALREYYSATKQEFAKTAADVLKDRCGEEERLPALGFIYKYKSTLDTAYLEKAVELAENIQINPLDAYDTDIPSVNSMVAVLFDFLGRITGENRWMEARKKQNHFIKLLAEKYPTRCSYGQCALLADEFGWKTVRFNCELPASVREFYAPTTEFLIDKSLPEGKIDIQ